MEKRATIKEVAEKAGVSKATVSYVLNNTKKVSESTKERVLQAARELQYAPDFTAVSLTKKKSRMIGVILPLINESIAGIMQENTYYNEMISAVEKTSRENNYDILLAGLARPEDYRSWVQKRRLDGLLFLGLFPEGIYKEMHSMDVPAVLIDTYESHTANYPAVNIDDEKGGWLAAHHLISNGHDKIVFLSVDLDNPVEKERFQGCTRALKEAGLPPPAVMKAEDIHSFESGYEAGRQIFQEKKYTAVISGSDTTALGIMRAVHDEGGKLPEDLSVVGFDDLRLSRYVIPSLTTIRQHIEKKGTLAAEKLVRVMEGQEEQPEMVDVELIIRESTGKR